MNLVKKKDYVGVDIAKFIMAIFVVAIHTHPFEGLESNLLVKIWNVMISLAVPFFFIASGYFLFMKINSKSDKLISLEIIKSYGKKIIKLYIYWTLIFLPITIWEFANNDSLFYEDIFLFIRGIFLVGENYYSWPLWYLLSMIYSLVLIYFLVKKDMKIKSIFIVSILVFIISLLMTFIMSFETNNEFILILSKLIKYVFGGGRLFSGMLYIMIGALLSNHKIKLSKATLLLLLIIGILFQIFKFPFISSFMFTLLPTVVFYILINVNVYKIRNGYFFRKCSTIMYFTHMIVFFLFTLIFKEFLYFGSDAFLVSTLIPILLTTIVLKNENRLPVLKSIF